MHAFAGLQPYNVLFGDKARGDECVKLLVVAGGDINSSMHGNYTPLQLASKRRSLAFHREQDGGDRDQAFATNMAPMSTHVAVPV